MSEEQPDRRPLQVERQLDIINLLRKESAVKVDELSERLGVSANTIRRDLKVLEKQGLLRRTQGGAIMEQSVPSLTPFSVRSHTNAPAKRSIAAQAARMIAPGDTVILDAGTTTYEMCRFMTSLQDVTVISNSLEIGIELARNPGLSVILCGGIILESSRCLVGLPAEQFFTQIHADTLFLSVRGVSLEKGFTNQNMHETPVKRRMIEAAKRVVAVADSTKLGHVALSTIAPVETADTLVTDKGAEESFLTSIESRGVETVRGL